MTVPSHPTGTMPARDPLAKTGPTTAPTRAMPHPSAPVLCFCLPHAGGSAAFFHPLATQLPPWMRLVPVDLPGKGVRSSEFPCDNFDHLARDVMQTIRTELSRTTHTGYVLFGHSMGALLAFHLAHALAHGLAQEFSREYEEHGPMHAFLSSPTLFFPQGTQTTRTEPPFHTLPSEQFLKTLQDIGGLSGEELATPEIIKHFEPIIRSDFAALATWSPPPRPPLHIPLTVFSGSEEGDAQLIHWAGRTNGAFTHHTFPGGHFYLTTHWQGIAAIMASALARSE